MNAATMVPNKVLQQIHSHLLDNCCFIDEGDSGFAAQWERPQTGACFCADANMADPAIQTIWHSKDANPKQIVMATFSVGSCQIPVLIAEYDSSRGEAFPRQSSLALTLSEHGIVIDPCVKSVRTRYASPLKLLLAQAGEPRLLWRGKTRDQNEEPSGRWLDRLAFGSLDPQFKQWISQIRRWEADTSELSNAHLVSLTSNLAHELSWGLGQSLLTLVSRIRSTDTLRTHLRLIYVEATKALRRKAKSIRAD